MGNCLLKQDSEDTSSFNDFFYVCREFKYLFRVSEFAISKHRYENSIKIRKDSGVGYLNDGRIVVAGGTDNSGCFTNRSYILDPVSSTITILPFMPVSTKEGSLYQYKDMIYYIGALKDTDDEEILTQEQSAPIMRYNLTTNNWEVFNEDIQKTININEILRKSNYKEIEEFDDINYRDILYPGTFMIGSRVYLVNGQYVSKRGILQPINKVFSIDLEQEGFDFREEQFSIPIHVFRPICGSYANTAFVTGGVKHSSKQSNKHSFLIDFSVNPATVQEIPGLKLDLDDTYPVISNENFFNCIAYPNVAIYDRQKKTWKQFKFDHIFVNRRDSKYETPMLNPKTIKGAENIRNNIRLTTLGKNIKVITDDVPSGESLSDIDLSMKIELPPGLLYDGVGKSTERSFSRKDSSGSSGQFSAERAIEIPAALNKGLSGSSDSLNKIGSNSSFSRESKLSDLHIVSPKAEPIRKKNKADKREDSDSDIIEDSSSRLNPQDKRYVNQKPAKNAPNTNQKKFNSSKSSSSSDSFDN